MDIYRFPHGSVIILYCSVTHAGLSNVNAVQAALQQLAQTQGMYSSEMCAKFDSCFFRSKKIILLNANVFPLFDEC